MSEYDNNKNGTGGGQGGYEDVCFICHRPESKAGRMFKLPNNICVCDDCMHKTMDSMSQFNFQGMMPPFYDMNGMMGGAGKPPTQNKKPEESGSTEIAEDGDEKDPPADDKEKQDGDNAPKIPRGFPNISFINLSD